MVLFVEDCVNTGASFNRITWSFVLLLQHNPQHKNNGGSEQQSYLNPPFENNNFLLILFYKIRHLFFPDYEFFL
jgi:hypothetical protein